MKELGLLSVRDYIGRSTYTPPAPGGSAFCVCCLTLLVQVHDFDGARAGVGLRFVCGGVGGAGQGQQGREEGHAPGCNRRHVMLLRHGCAQLPPPPHSNKHTTERRALQQRVLPALQC